MKIGRENKTCFVSLILLLSSLSFLAIVSENADAQEATEATTLYFHDYIMTGIVNQIPPSAGNESQWPPKITDVEEWLAWFVIWLTYKEFPTDEFNPFKITEEYYYEGEEELEVKGDVVFDLYFASTLSSKILKDQVEVSIDYYGTRYNATETIISSLSGSKIQKTEVVIENVDFTLNPDDFLIVSVEIIPTDKPIGDIIEMQNESIITDILNATEQAADWIKTNLSMIPQLGEIADLILEVVNYTELYNLSFDEIADLASAMSSSSFVYDSKEHPSSLTLPGETPFEEEDENIKTYYLHTEKIMDETEPVNEKPSEVKLSGSKAKWDGPSISRSKILKEATASLYLDHRDLIRLFNLLKGKITVIAKLFYKDNEIDTTSKQLSRTTLLDLLVKPEKPTVFSFKDLEEREITYETGISLEISASKGSTFGFRKNVKLLYDSVNYPSSLALAFNDTNHIQIEENPYDEKVALGESVIYTLNVSSEFKEEKIQMGVSGFSSEEKGMWDVDIEPNEFNISSGGKKTVNIEVTSTDTDLESYGKVLDVVFTAGGKTGRALFPVNIEVSEDAIEYDIDIVVPEDKEIKYDTSKIYQFEIRNNNTGYWSDSYSVKVISEHDWKVNVSYGEDVLEELSPYPYVADGEYALVNVTVFVPQDYKADTDKLIFEATSEEGDISVAVNVTTTVIGPNVIEAMYDYFESLGEDTGLADALDSSYLAALLLATLVFIILFVIIILLVYFFTIKYVSLICFERIKEISPDEEANYEITVKNPFKKKLSYDLLVKKVTNSSGWDALLDKEHLELESKQSKTVRLTVVPTSYVKSDDWIEIKVAAKVTDKNKSSDLSTVTAIKDAKAELKILGVFHWPRVFKKGDKVVTSFRVENKGNAAAAGVNVILYVNGEEKNKVEDITIPSGGYAEIEMPWIAVKGKNDVDIAVK